MAILLELGARITELRRRRRLSREALAKKAGLSVRFLAEVEAGRGNISLTRLSDLSAALDVSLPNLLSVPAAKRNGCIALIGLRGAGKTTIGKKLAAALRWKFFELDGLIEKAAGLTLQNIFEVHGEEYYRNLELQVLSDFLEKGKHAVLATGGGIVTREETYDLLRQNCVTFWLKADPADHWNRVLQQDPRPIANYPDAFTQLQNLLERRQPLYSLADFQIDTSKLGLKQSVEKIVEVVRA